ncbi:hypothetical protein [Lacipirellula limnantheis]|uniref:PEP-CTERM protein-sorting domain-containing protein n=1 Tax=Lacipirellula limnantheis TaxID=2528024 RepID=A0A517TYY4_9BACT|nr:hypothetical protein [Lacipirellula limnantheis]QDT73587.1 hypothetical protein I41_27760 [Lacipirellula limnantheis]
MTIQLFLRALQNGRLLIALLLTAAAADPAWAQVTRFSFEATVELLQDSNHVFGDLLNVGSILTGSFVVDLTVPDSAPDNTTSGSYLMPAALNDFALVSGEFSAFSTGDFQFAGVSDGESFPDFFTVGFTIDTVPSAIGSPGIDFMEVAFDFEDQSASALSSDSLVEAVAANPAAWSEISFDMFGEDEAGTGNPFVLRATVTTISATPLSLADFTHDGVVDAGDLAAWKAGFAGDAEASHAQGDADNDSHVDGADFLIWQRNVGVTAGVSVVPEPVGLLLGAAALSGCAFVPKRR